MNLSEQQSAALFAVRDWYSSKTRKQVFRIFGYAGVGKTTLAKEFAESINGTVLYAAYTGKAALMMQNNGCSGASTIHSLIYKAEEQKDGSVVFKLNKNSPLRHAALLIIDECSMVNDEIAHDLLRFNVPVLVLGDPAQLPPVSGEGYFTNAEPDVMLTEIHRQAKDNPIIYLATSVREGNKLKPGKYGDSIIEADITSADEFASYSQIIVGRNNSRTTVNSVVRNMLGIKSTMPIANDRLICLKNDKDLGILNGEMFSVNTVIPPKSPTSKYGVYKLLDIDTADKNVSVRIHNSFFDGTTKPDWKFLKGTQEFDFGYAITAHKSQGSQWNDVLILDESWCFREDANRWLYTAITRAQTKVLIYQT